MHKLNTIVLTALGHHDEGVAGGTVYPGQAVRLQAAGTLLQETLTQSNASKAGMKIAKEAGIIGSPYLDGVTTGQRGTVDAPYSVNNQLFFYVPVQGDILNVLVDVGQTVAVGDLLGVAGAGNGNFIQTASATGNRNIALTNLRAPTALVTPLGATGSSTIIGLVTGTVGTNAPQLQSADSKAASQTPKAIFEYVLPDDYVAGNPLTVRCNAGMKTSIADTSATLTVEAFRDAGDGTVGANIGPAAQSINSLTEANKDFVITPTTLNPGDKVIFRITFTIVDAATGTAVIAVINDIRVLAGVVVGAQLEALEASGGALAAATLLRARVL